MNNVTVVGVEQTIKTSVMGRSIENDYYPKKHITRQNVKHMSNDAVTKHIVPGINANQANTDGSLGSRTMV